MAFDFKKEYKEFYMPKSRPEIVNVPKANYIAVRGKGNPNTLDGEYQQAISVLYAVAYTLKMSYKTDYRIEGFFEYVVPPLEGFWWQDGVVGVDYENKDSFHWISVIRLPDFVTKKDFEWAVETATKKKKLDCSKAEFLTIDEGLCVQIMHIGSYDNEPQSVAVMDAFLKEQGYENDINEKRLHHEIYMSDARKVAPEKWKTVIRHPIRKSMVYEKCPVFENEKFLLRMVTDEDADDLLKVYSDAQAVPLFNSDNCHGDDFHYETIERMKQAMDFWSFSYRNRYFVRWAIIDKSMQKAVGTIELFNRTSEDYFNNCGILRLDLSSDYENAADIKNILSLIIEPAYDLFGCNLIATKAIKAAKERRSALLAAGFVESSEKLVGHDGTEYDSYFCLQKRGM